MQIDTQLNKIATRSKSDKAAIFNWLMPHFNQQALTECFQRLDGNKAVGIDGMTKEQYGANLSENINNLVNKLKTMSYRPLAVKQVHIPKEGKPGQTRPLGISAFEDKIVQLRMAQILNAIYEPLFSDSSHGFRPGRNCHSALKQLHGYLSWNANEVIIDVDLKNFFGLIQHNALVELLRYKIKDECFIRYIIRMLKAGILDQLDQGNFVLSEEGSPQGNIASPILANVYAHYVIDIWLEQTVLPYLLGKIKAIRYADDIVICVSRHKDADRIVRTLIGRLNKYGLELNLDKTKIISFNKWSKTKQGFFDFLGFTLYLRKSRKRTPMIGVMTSKKRFNAKLQKVKLWCRENRHKARIKSLWQTFSAKLRDILSIIVYLLIMRRYENLCIRPRRYSFIG